MKTTILTFALALATMPLTFAQTPKPAAPAEGSGVSKPAATAAAKTTKKHHKKAVKKTVKPAAATAAPAK
jgi:hypothetical protein